MKVEIMQSLVSHKILESKVNAFITENNIEIIDIKYSTCIWSYSAMVMYQELHHEDDSNNNQRTL